MSDMPILARSVSAGGLDLTALATGSTGTVTTLYLNGGGQSTERAHRALDLAGSPNLNRMLDAIGDDAPTSRVFFAPAEGDVRSLTIEEPLRFDVARTGSVYSFGTLLESDQSSAPHAVVTIEDDMFGLTSFGSVTGSDDGPVSVCESVLTAIEQLRKLDPTALALVGSQDSLDRYAPSFAQALPMAWTQHYPTDDIDENLTEVSDAIVVDARTRAAELLTHELAQFRTARETGHAVEGLGVVELLDGDVITSLLVRDDPDDQRMIGDDRLVDVAVHRAVAKGTRVIMIPHLDDEQGPSGGLGGHLRGS